MLLVSCQSLGMQDASTALRLVWGSTPSHCSRAPRAGVGLHCCTDAGAAVWRTLKQLVAGPGGPLSELRRCSGAQHASVSERLVDQSGLRDRSAAAGAGGALHCAAPPAQCQR